MEAFMGTVMPVAFNYAPKGWAFCNGQVMSIQQNSAMFALLGTAYGGDGVNTFGLPDLRGRVVVGSQANGPGIDPVVQGQKAGTSNANALGVGRVTVMLTVANLPAHTHDASGLTAATDLQVSNGSNGAVAVGAGSLLSGSPSTGGTSAGVFLPAGTAPTNPVMLGGVTSSVSGNTGSTGSGTPLDAPVQTTAQVSVMQPYLGLNYIIAMQGIFPSRN